MVKRQLTRRPPASVGRRRSNGYVLVSRADGTIVKENGFGRAGYDRFTDVAPADGRIVVVGYTHPHGGEVNDLFAATLAPDGTVERIERFGGDGDDRAILAKLGSDGTVWIVGQTASSGAGGSDLLLTSLDESGAFTGKAVTLGGPADDNGTAVLELDPSVLLVAGYSRNLGVGGQDAFIVRLTRPAAGPPHASLRRTVVKAP